MHTGWSAHYPVRPTPDLRVLAEPDAVIEALLPAVERAMDGKPKKWAGEKMPERGPAKPPDASDPKRKFVAHAFEHIELIKDFFNGWALPIGWRNPQSVIT